LTTSWTATAPEAVRTRRTNRELTGSRLASHPILSDQIPATRLQNQLVSASLARDACRGVMSQVGFVLLRREQNREAARDEDGRRSQAVKVSAWVEAQRTAQGGREVLFFVHNASDMPIYEVSLPTPDEDDGEAEFIGLVPPGQTIQRPAPREWLATYYAPEPVEIEFLDSSGRQWARNEQGFLAPSGGSGPPE
jgi:hypothetical protein